MAHCFGADLLINLGSLMQTGSLRLGDRILALDSGHNFWGAAALEVS